MNAFKGLWLGAVEMGSVEVVLVFHHTHTHIHLPAAKARRPFPAVTVFRWNFPLWCGTAFGRIWKW